MVYRPPDGGCDQLIELLTEQLTSLNKWRCDTMIIGDININLLKPRENRAHKLSDFRKSQGLMSMIMGTTCHHDLSGSCIDHIMVNRAEMFAVSGIIEINASDHNLIYAFRKQPKINKDTKHIWCHRF